MVPHHGDTPISGQATIRDYWFNQKYPPTVIPYLVRETEEIFISGDVGLILGRSHLTWEYEGVRTTIPASNYVLVAERGTEG